MARPPNRRGLRGVGWEPQGSLPLLGEAKEALTGMATETGYSPADDLAFHLAEKAVFGGLMLQRAFWEPRTADPLSPLSSSSHLEEPMALHFAASKAFVTLSSIPFETIHILVLCCITANAQTNQQFLIVLSMIWQRHRNTWRFTSSSKGRQFMSLFQTWSGKITIPALPTAKLKVGSTVITHSPTRPFEVNATIHESQVSGYLLLDTDASPPFDKLCVREQGAKRKKVGRGVLTSELPRAEWGRATAFRWDEPQELAKLFDSPEKVISTWQNQFRFRTADPERRIVGLRKPQIGALHAISAHFAVGSNHEPATIVLPTGTGKTETMLADLVYDQIPRLLVLVPSDALRMQIAEKFETLGVLREMECLPPHACSPRVARLTSGLRTVEEAHDVVGESNVIVALPDTLEACDAAAAHYLFDQCSALFVDEAHHIAAQTWKRTRDRFVGKKVVQFTATPFRRDRKHIGGKIIFNYKLGDAQRDLYYQPIRLYTVEEFGDEASRDLAIAQRAISILREDRKEYDHLLMARAKTKTKAEELLPLYQLLAPDLKPVVVYSGAGMKRQNARALKSLRDKTENGSRIVICVDMLGEGFDLPELKVAAIHDNHKSLAVTLQFVGRFTRGGENVGNAAVVVNIADPNAEKRLEELYSEGADWDHVISRLSEGKITDELRLQEVVESLKTTGDLHQKISLWNLNPKLSTQIYRTNCDEWAPHHFSAPFPKDAKLWHAISIEQHLLVVVAQQKFDVHWGRYENIQEVTYDLLIAYWDKSQNVLFVHASDYERMRVSDVADSITSSGTELLSGPRVFNVLNNVELPLAKSLGSSRFGAISFTSYFGPNVTEGLASIEKSESQLNYIGCLGYENGEKVLWGAAQRKAKIWQSGAGSIDDWMTWCQSTYTKLMDDSGRGSNITRDFLRPQKLTSLYKEHPISVQWGEYLQSSFSDSLSVIFNSEEVPLYLADAEIVSASAEEVQIAIQSEEHRSVYAFRINRDLEKGFAYYHLDGPVVSFRISRHTIRDFDKQMYHDPLIVRYADGTFSYNNFHIPFDLGATDYPRDQIVVWDWEGVNLNRESMGIGLDRKTVQYRSYEMLAEEFDLIINDDGPGEAGDLVCLKDDGSQAICLCLVHCKNANDGRPSNDIRNLYTVCGQAQKSITAKHEGLKKLSTDLRRRHEKWVKRGGSRLLKGDLKRLSYFVEKSRKVPVKFEVIIVQPGISRSSLTADMAKLLATTELFLRRTTEAQFTVVGSQ
jgi:superfamily II DNA or RNA helicase